MITSLRRLLALAALSAVLVSCGGERASVEKPAPGAEATPEVGRAGAGGAAPPVARPRSGLTPVVERAATSTRAPKTVALTFDADMTADQGSRAAAGERFDNPELISTLKRLKVPATVFMTSRWAEEYPEQAKAIGSDPLFEIANHSYSHHSFTARCYGLPTIAEDDMRADVERAFRAFRRVGAEQVVPYFRFPGGCYDTTALRALAPAKVTAVQWDVVSGDAFATDADAVAEQVLSGVRPGSVVVMHCTRSAAPVTEEAIRTIVPKLRERGYRMVKVSELLREGVAKESR